jgi:hypothetical protein
MNTTLKGDLLEGYIFDLFSQQIAAGDFWGNAKNCKIFQKKGYYSKDREKNIIFDVSIEFYLPGSSQYSLVTFIECKNYSHSVSVDDVEEFFTKTQQVAASNSKAIIASTASFQSGAMTFARSKGIGLLRYFDSSNFKWELNRSPSTSAYSDVNTSYDMILDGLSVPDFVSNVFDLYMQSPTGLTNSAWDFFEKLLNDTNIPSEKLDSIRNQKGRPSPLVPFLEQAILEKRSLSILRDIGYQDGEVSLHAICAREATQCGLVVKRTAHLEHPHSKNTILGQICFAPLEIRLYDQPILNSGRERFTLAHELAHHFLGHSKYMFREVCEEDDFALPRTGSTLEPDIARLEYQANIFASCLLMPKDGFVQNFARITQWLGIANRGFGALYVDDQHCNQQHYLKVTHELMGHYGVSRAAASIRLESLGLLRFYRTEPHPQLHPLQEFFDQLLNTGVDD